MRDIYANNHKMSINECGEGKSIIFIHSILGNKEQWDYYMNNISPGYRKISYDLRGHGNSEVTKDKYDIDLFVEDLKNLIEELNLKNVVLVGHSVGAIIALKYVEKYGKDNIKKLVLISCSTKLNYPTHSDDIEAEHDVNKVNEFYASYFCNENHLDVKKRLISDWLKISPLTYRCLNILNCRFPEIKESDSFKNIKTLIIFGNEDKIINSDNKKKLLSLFINKEFMFIDNTGHFNFLEEKEKVCYEIGEFL